MKWPVLAVEDVRPLSVLLSRALGSDTRTLQTLITVLDDSQEH